MTNTERSTKVAKELFADYMKEKKLREPEEKKELSQTLKTFHVEARKEGFIQCIIKQLFGFQYLQISFLLILPLKLKNDTFISTAIAILILILNSYLQ